MTLFRPAKPKDFDELNRIAYQVKTLHASWGSCDIGDIPYPMDFFLEIIEGRHGINSITSLYKKLLSIANA